MKLYFCTHIEDPETGITVIPDFECEVDADLEWLHGEPVITITSVYRNGVELMRSKQTLFQQLGLIAADKAEDDDELLARLIEAEREAA